MSSHPLLEAKELCKSYPGPEGGVAVPVLQGVGFQMEAGDTIAITGPSGCGKSTLLNLLGAMDQPDSGSVLIGGQDITQLNPKDLAGLRARHIGFIFQMHHLLPQCSALENVLVPTLALSQVDRAEVSARAKELLAKAGLGDRMAYRPGQLSGGEKQRVAVVRALINNPSVILADEPTGSLDEETAFQLTDLLINLVKERQTSLVMVTHHPAQAQRMDRVFRLHKQQLLEDKAE